MKRCLLFVCFVILEMGNVLGQTFNIRERNNKASLAFETILKVNQNIYLFSSYRNPVAPYDGRVGVSLLQSDGSVDSIYDFETNSPYYFASQFHSSIQTASKNIVIIGGYGYFNPSYNSFVLKLNESFQFKALYSFEDTMLSTNFLVDVNEGIDGSLYLLNIYQKRNSSIIYTKVFHVDSAGALIWEKTYINSQFGNSLYGNVINKCGNTFLIAGESNLGAGYIGPNVRPKLIFIDTGGVVQKEQYLDWKVKGVHGMVMDTSDKSIVYCSRIWDSIDRFGYPNYSPYIAKVDSQGNTVWKREMGRAVASYRELYSTFNQVKKLRNGSYLTIGSTAVYETDTSGYIGGYLVKFSETNDSSNVIWERKYRGIQKNGTQHYLYDFIELPDGRIIACGNSDSPDDNYPDQGWILGLDSFGCLVPGCEQWTAIAEKDNETNPQLRLYPNPMQDVLYFDVQGASEQKSYELVLQGVDGREVVRTTVTPQVQYTFNTEPFAKGTYLFTLSENGKVVEKRKLVKQ